jgi:hypothetical protein
LLPEFGDQIAKPCQVLFGSLQFLQSVFTAELKPVDACHLLNELTPFLRRQKDQAVNFSLTDESVTVGGKPQLKEQILDIAKPARDSVDSELAFARPLQPSGDDDFGDEFVGANNLGVASPFGRLIQFKGQRNFGNARRLDPAVARKE